MEILNEQTTIKSINQSSVKQRGWTVTDSLPRKRQKKTNDNFSNEPKNSAYSINMHEAVKKGPKKDVSEEAAKQTVREDNVALLEVRLILQAVLLQHKQAQYPVGDEKEEKSVEPRQSQNARRGAR